MWGHLHLVYESLALACGTHISLRNMLQPNVFVDIFNKPKELRSHMYIGIACTLWAVLIFEQLQNEDNEQSFNIVIQIQ